MGILTNTRKPVEREPVVLVNDHLYEDEHHHDSGRSSNDFQIPSFVDARLDQGANPPPPGTGVFIICPGEGKPTAWTSDPMSGEVGCVEGLEGAEIARFCQFHQRGLTGTIGNSEKAGNSKSLRILIDAK